ASHWSSARPLPSHPSLCPTVPKPNPLSRLLLPLRLPLLRVPLPRLSPLHPRPCCVASAAAPVARAVWGRVRVHCRGHGATGCNGSCTSEAASPSKQRAGQQDREGAQDTEAAGQRAAALRGVSVGAAAPHHQPRLPPRCDQ
ncbi:unnamed protein product, partial [Closterium sp. Naga37s-1]